MTIAHCKQTMAAALLIVLLVGCGDTSAPNPEQKEGGQQAFDRYCASCHGAEGQGRPPTFPPLAGSEWLDLPPEGLTAIILSGLRGEIEVAGQAYAGYMPPMRHIGDSDVAAILGFITRRWSEAGVEWTQEEVAAVRSAVAGQGMPEGRAGLERLMETLP